MQRTLQIGAGTADYTFFLVSFPSLCGQSPTHMYQADVRFKASSTNLRVVPRIPLAIQTMTQTSNRDRTLVPFMTGLPNANHQEVASHLVTSIQSAMLVKSLLGYLIAKRGSCVCPLPKYISRIGWSMMIYPVMNIKWTLSGMAWEEVETTWHQIMENTLVQQG